MPYVRLLFLGTFLIGAALRAQTSYQLSGTIASVAGTTAFTVGQPFTITIGYQSGLTDSAPGSSAIGIYQGAITSYTFNYNNGAYIGTASNGRFFVYNNFELGTDAVQMDIAGSTSFPAVNGNAFNSSASGPFFFLTNQSGLQFGSDAQPTTFPTSGWDSGRFSLGWGTGMDFDMAAITLEGNITTVSAIPEPGTYAAIAGLLALGLAAWRRHQRCARG